MRERRKRKDPRARMRATATVVRLQYATDSAPEVSRTVTCRITDISIGGIRISADWQMPFETPLKVTVMFKSPPAHFHPIGRVRWVQRSSEPDRFLTGIEFTEKDEETLAAWREFLQERYPELA